MKLNFFNREGRPYYEANVWIYNGKGDPLLLEYFTTKREAVACIKLFTKTYKGEERLDCYVNRFDEEGNWEDYFNVL